MKKFILFILLFTPFNKANSQILTHIFFNLYTDSLKKGTNNYINVDGKLSNGNFKPLTSKDVIFTTSYGSFEGNDLVLPWDYKQDSCIVTVTAKNDKNLTVKKVIFIQKLEDPELPTAPKELIKPTPKTKESSKKKRKKKG